MLNFKILLKNLNKSSELEYFLFNEYDKNTIFLGG